MTHTIDSTTEPAPKGLSFHPIGTDAPAPEQTPVGADDRAVIGVFENTDAAEAAVRRLIDAGFPAERISIVSRDMVTETRINGFVTTGDIAGPAAASGAWVGGLFGLLAGSAVLFIPGAGPLVVLGPLAAAAIGAAYGALVGGGMGAVLGSFVAEEHIPKYERLVRAGRNLVVVHGAAEDVERARRILDETGSTDVQRHDQFRAATVGPIAHVHEGMPVVDPSGQRIGKVELVKLGDPEAVTTQGQDTVPGEPRVSDEARQRLLRLGFIKIDRRGMLRPDVYAAADQIGRVQNGVVHLSVGERDLLRAL
jgi:hypothetical protein